MIPRRAALLPALLLAVAACGQDAASPLPTSESIGSGDAVLRLETSALPLSEIAAGKPVHHPAPGLVTAFAEGVADGRIVDLRGSVIDMATDWFALVRPLPEAPPSPPPPGPVPVPDRAAEAAALLAIADGAEGETATWSNPATGATGTVRLGAYDNPEESGGTDIGCRPVDRTYRRNGIENTGRSAICRQISVWYALF